MFGGFNSSKLKPQLKMGVSRIQIASNKKSALLKQNMREIALMLSEDPPREEKAKIRAEALIRDDNMIEAYEILQLECELLHERIKLIEYSKLCPPDLVSVVSTLMWAAHRVDIPELLEIRKQFRAKYGKQFEEDALSNAGGVLNERVVTKLSVHPPAAYLVQTYLERICEQFEVTWSPKVKLSTNEMIEPMAAPIGYSVQVAQGTGLGSKLAPHNYAYTGSESGAPSGSIPSPMDHYHWPDEKKDNGGGGGSGGNDFAEVDIFVPSAPSGPATPTSTMASPTTGNNKDDDDHYDNNGEGHDEHNNGASGAGSSGSGGATYDDLAARFQMLKK
ncbi:hypothetical protein MPSEU_000994600 [Mayamaea pseudoterrestris]|nr:hypothetical protein MPSEU_000994600 [Mayamaea pseudoterrestris]